MRMVEICIPKKNKVDTERYVAVNGQNMLIKTGVTVEVPYSFAEVIAESLRCDEAAEAFIEANSNN